MPNIVEGSLTAQGLKFGIVVSRFNHFITDKLLEGALDALYRNGVEEKNVEVYKVPGSFEIPLLAKRLADAGNYDALICLGAIIRGGTIHYDHIAAEVTKGIAVINLEGKTPISLGVITSEDIEQAIERAGTKMGNKGWDAALAAIEMVNLLKKV
ncbi:MAG: 6,7-dimethyl-8-ribityllumazine synthase [Deltaproteobacteria bacterium]|nr:MAG: 6,7-dimethyl-8-ribityllumazine synthase [Deltaproteobacteria bacterium]